VNARRWSVVLAALSVAFVLYCAIERRSLATVWGDESTYMAMAESLVRDGDLRFTEADAERLRRASPPSRGAVILQRSEEGVGYSKPVLYALLTAPAVLVAAGWGLVLTNLLCLALAGWLGWLFLCRLGDRHRATLTMVTFLGASILLAQVGWKMSDLAQAALSLAGLVLALACLRRPPDGAHGWLDGSRSAWFGGVLLGLVVSLRLPNALIAGAALAALLAAGRRWRALRVAAAAVIAFVGISLLGQMSIGSANPYKAVRSSFNSDTGYPVHEQDPAHQRFDDHPTTQRMGIMPNWRPRVSAYAALYFWIGRHSGVLWYFPAIVALLATALRRPDRVSAVLLAGAGLATAFFLIWWPENYFGGAAFLGNRYFLAVYPLLLVALPRLPRWPSPAVSWILAVGVAGSVIASLATAEVPMQSSQSHTRAGLLALSPYESTARAIDGRRDRYWARDLLRFVHPVAGVGPESFVLTAGRPPVEILLVTREADSSILLRYQTRTPGMELVIDDADGERRLALDRGRVGSFTVPLAAAWRRHAFWWDREQEYSARTVRLAVAGASGQGRATFWYGGDPAELDKSFDYKVERGGVQLPSRVDAGSLSELEIQVRNMSSVPWHSTGAYPVTLSYQMTLSGAGEPTTLEGPRVALPEDLPSGDPVRWVLPVTWPATPGRYRVVIDLLVEHYSWFGDRVGRSIAVDDVEVVAPEAAAR
jgi:hypothetical protein